jgi:hypothetical protein
MKPRAGLVSERSICVVAEDAEFKGDREDLWGVLFGLRRGDGDLVAAEAAEPI